MRGDSLTSPRRPVVSPEWEAPDEPIGLPDDQPWERPLAAVRRYRWLIVAMLVIGAAGGVVATRFTHRVYQAHATVWIQSAAGEQSGETMGPIRAADLLNSTPSWIELFRSFRIVDATVRNLALYLRTDVAADRALFASFEPGEPFSPGRYELVINRASRRWQLRAASGDVIERGAESDSVGRRVGFRWVIPATAFAGVGTRTIKFSVASPRETSMAVLSRMSNQLAVGSNFLWLTYEDADPQLAARTLNTWLNEYVRVAAELKTRNLIEYSSILRDQLQYAERATQDAESAYQQFRINTITLPTESGPVAAGASTGVERDPALQSFFEQKIAYDNLRHDRAALEQALANAAAGKAPYEGMLLIPSVAQGANAEALREAFRSLYEAQARLRVERQTFTDEYPTVRQLNATVTTLQTRTIPELAQQLLTQLAERSNDYERRISGASRELRQIPPRTIEEMRLQRAVVVAEGLYTNLKNRYAEAQLAEASATPDVSILDTAVAPVAPMRDKSALLMLMAIVASLGTGIGAALLLDRVDPKLRYARQAIAELGLPIAGTVPRIPAGGLQLGSPEQVVQFVESFRTLRMHVLQSGNRRPVLAVTSAAPDDGKSLVAANLALSFADAGLRTALVDADTRRGELHRMFDVESSNGVTEYLTGARDLPPALVATRHANLWLMPSGRRMPRSPELLSSPRLQELSDRLAAEFDAVVFDTPPLAAGIDAFAVSAATGRALIVLRLGKTERRLAALKLSVLDRLPVEIIGAVLNGVELHGEFQYYSYSSGYAIGGEQARDAISSGAGDGATDAAMLHDARQVWEHRHRIGAASNGGDVTSRQ